MSRLTPALLTAALEVPTAHAVTPESLMHDYTEEAHHSTPTFNAPSAALGQHFFERKHGEWSCSSCHTINPAAPGRHAVTGKAIAPLAPAANPKSFRDTARVEKWFRRNCNDTLDGPCTAAEKADLIAYLLSVRKGG
jgi:cytochrome c peroxidase